MLVRVRHRGGMERIQVQETDDIQVLIDKIVDKIPGAQRDQLTLSNQGPGVGERSVHGLKGTLQGFEIRHGDLLFANFPDTTPAGTSAPSAASSTSQPPPPSSSGVAPTANAPSKPSKPWETASVDPVDVFWDQEDGKIKRSRDGRMCRHGDKGMCDFCMPLEPFDAGYLAEHKIKHLSYHSYVRKITSANPASRTSSSYIPPLSNPDFRVHVPCPSGSHPDYPRGICTKCQPSAITLQHQPYRTVDHVEFASASVLEGLVDFWRRMGTQRFGFMLGRYERYADVPMGVKAVVEAIHEPPQEGYPDGLVVGLPWEEEERVARLAEHAGLKVVGMIYTDLTPDRTSDEAQAAGKVSHKRHVQSYFLSSLEAVFAATMQAKHRMPSRFSDSGEFSSRWVTCILSGNADGGIEASAYLLSDQAMGLVEADLIEASVDPGTMRIKMDEYQEAAGVKTRRYVPDVFHRYKNEYGKEVQESAKPCFPVEYLLVTLSQGAPIKAAPAFITEKPFPTEARAGMDDQTADRVIQDVSSLVRNLPNGYEFADLGRDESESNAKGKGRAVEPDVDSLLSIVRWLSDWHLLNYLDQSGWFDSESMALAGRIATTHDLTLLGPFFRSAGWGILAAHAGASGADPSPIQRPSDLPKAATTDASLSGGGDESMEGVEGEALPCPHCTYAYNEPGWDTCQVCTLPPTW